METLSASFYGEIDRKNPVISAFDRDIKAVITCMKQVNNLVHFDNISYSKGARNLLEIWNKNKPRLPSTYYEEHVLKIADFLFELKFYNLAMWQGYSLHLQQFGVHNILDIKDVDHFRRCFFLEGLDPNKAKLAFRAIQGCIQCVFHREKEKAGPPSQETVQTLVSLLCFVRIMMQAILPHEELCWLLYNGSLHIYNISRYLMSMSRTAQVVEFLLWACICLETSVPLMTSNFLSWRATLYCAVCQCHYDNQAGIQAEVFARRALGKISELGKLEETSAVPTTVDSQRAYKEAVVKLAVMVFKRSVYESRRRPKGVFRPKPKGTLREVPNMPWPRNATERVLIEMFEGNAAQFLAVLEALWDSSRRPLQSGLPDEPDAQEVVLELLSAGISLLSGMGSSTERIRDESLPTCLNGLTPVYTLMEMATTGQNKVSLASAVRFLRLLYRFEQWEVFLMLSVHLFTVLRNMEGAGVKKLELELGLLESMVGLAACNKARFYTREDSINAAERDRPGVHMCEEFIRLVQALHTCVCDNPQEVQPDRDLVLDIVLFVWTRCKVVFQRAQLHHYDPVRFLGRLENPDKWVWCLCALCEVSHAFGLAETDPIVLAEMTVRLARVLESTAAAMETGREAASKEDDSAACPPPQQSGPSLFKRSKKELLHTASEVVQKGLEGLDRAWPRLLPCDGSVIADNSFMQKHVAEGLCPPRAPAGGEEADQTKSSPLPASLPLVSIGLYLELWTIKHQVDLKLLSILSAGQRSGGARRVARPTEPSACKAKGESLFLHEIKKNRLSRALFLIQKALLAHSEEPGNSSTKRLLEDAVVLIEKAESEEKKLFTASAPSTPAPPSEKKDRGNVGDKKIILPPPLLLQRTSHSMVFTPAPHPLQGQVCWYHLYGREVDSVDLKARLGDCRLRGTGDVVPAAGKCLLKVEGLELNQTYVFAVAAYDAQGKLLGNTIGESTRPILASVPLPILATWARLAQGAFQTGQHAMASRACTELWSHFTHPGTSKAGPAHEGLAHTSLRLETLHRSSPVLLQWFVSSILIQTEIHIQEGALFCDRPVQDVPILWGQEARLAECDRLLVAVDVALWLNDSSAALQAIVGCYGLLAPVMFHQILYEPVVQVLMKCLVVLQEISSVIKQRRSSETTESLMHMIACITGYLTKEPRVSSSALEQGRRLLQEVFEAQQTLFKEASEEPERIRRAPGQEEVSEELKALEGSNLKNRRNMFLSEGKAYFYHEMSGTEEPVLLYNVVSNNPLKTALRDVMKFKRKPCFLEFAALLLQRSIQEDQLELAVQWGQDFLQWLSRRDDTLGQVSPVKDNKEVKKAPSDNSTSKRISKGPPPSQQSKKMREIPQKKKQAGVASQNADQYERVVQMGSKAVDSLMTQLAVLLRSNQKKRQRRQLCFEEGLWRSHINFSLGQAYLGLLRRSLELFQGTALVHSSYRQLAPSLFSLASAGTMVHWKNAPQQYCPLDVVLRPLQATSLEGSQKPMSRARGKEPTQGRLDTSADTGTGASGVNPLSLDTEGDTETDSPQVPLPSEAGPGENAAQARRTGAQVQDFLNKASVHFRRAMVLAHRGGHWTTLQFACRAFWDKACGIFLLVGQGAQVESRCPLTMDHLYNVFTPLLVTAADLLMDMMEKRKLWDLYDVSDDEEHEAAFHYSPNLDDGTVVDVRWLKTLVLNTLELLFLWGKFETLAHFALLFNTYTRERYTHMVTPLLVHAQRRLLERVAFFGGPPAPQPHYVKTQQVTGEEITCRNYARSQLLCGWTPPVDIPQSSSTSSEYPNEPAVTKQSKQSNSQDRAPVEPPGGGLRGAYSLICVPLDMKDTLRCFRQALERGQHTLQTFTHSRRLLTLLLAHTQTPLELPFAREFSALPSSARRDARSAALSLPGIGPPDLSREDYSNLGSLWSDPLAPEHINIVINSYTSSIKNLQADCQDSLRVQALHDLGNLHYYNGNRRAAHTIWSQAVDCALQSSNVFDSWDGVSWGGGTPVQILKQSGIWGCLQAAVLTAKIAQLILTSNITHRTMCCLLSAHLFKCVLRASLPHPQSDLQYASYSIGEELIPGVDLFSERSRGRLGVTVASLGFLCHWLYTAGQHVKLLPMLALYQHLACTVCRDTSRTVEAKVLKVQALTELSLFSLALKEVCALVLAEDIPHPCGRTVEKQSASKKFNISKTLLDPSNSQALEELLNCRLAPETSALYGPRLSRRVTLAHAQLLLALSSSICTLPETVDILPEIVGCAVEVSRRTSSTSLPSTARSDSSDSDRSTQVSSREAGSPQRVKEPKPQSLKDKLTPDKVKSVLLRGACTLLNPSSQLHRPQSALPDAEDLELAIESCLLLADLFMQHGHTTQSTDMAVSALVHLQTSPVVTEKTASPVYPQSRPKVKRPSVKDVGGVREGLVPALVPEPGETPQGVESRERIGPALWLRCRVALVRGLVQHIPGTTIFPGIDSSVEAARMLQEGLQECEAWGDPDTRASLLLMGTTMDTHRGLPRTESTAKLQEVVSLLSGRTALPPASSVRLAEATLMLSDLRAPGNDTLLLLTQKLLMQQLSVFGESVGLGDGGKIILPPTGLTNIYLPHLPLLAKATFQLGHSKCIRAMTNPPPSDCAGSDPKRPCSPKPARDSSHKSACIKQWGSVHEVVGSSLMLLQACSSTDRHLEADVLYCRGLVERCLYCFGDCTRDTVTKTFMDCIQVTMRDSHNLPLIRKCYLEIALLFLKQWECTELHEAAPPTVQKEEKKVTGWKRVVKCLNRGLSGPEGCLLLYWVCQRGAAKTTEAVLHCGQLSESNAAKAGQLPSMFLRLLPKFALNDLLVPCGGVEQMSRQQSNPAAFLELGPSISGRKNSQVTWAHLVRYYTHLYHLQHIATRPVSPLGRERRLWTAGELSLAQRLVQLQGFFSAYMVSYQDHCLPPEPAPKDIICQPRLAQLSATVKASVDTATEPYQWSVASKRQLCLQWHQRDVDLNLNDQDKVILLYGLNNEPICAMKRGVHSVTVLRCGQYSLCVERVKVVHSQLCTLCAEADLVLPAGINLPSTSSSAAPPNIKVTDKAAPQPPNSLMKLQENVLSCCNGIKDLLQPGSKTPALTEVPFTADLQSLSDLEHCFNPVGGAIMENNSLIGWLITLLIKS